MDVSNTSKKEAQIEDRKDKRTKIQASQQSQMISQRQNDSAPTDFEAEDSITTTIYYRSYLLIFILFYYVRNKRKSWKA